MRKIRVNALKPYEVVVGSGVLNELEKDKRAVVVTQAGARKIAESSFAGGQLD